MKTVILRAPGTNCDEETAHAFERAGSEAERLHLNRVLESPDSLDDAQILCIPGGFSFGDDVGAGVLFASRLGALTDGVAALIDRGGLVLGICNGFQVLLKMGLLPYGVEGLRAAGGGVAAERPATLTWNTNGRYDARWVRLRVAARENVFLRGIEAMDCPVAHAEGRLVLSEGVDLSAWAAAGHVAVCYREADDQRSFSADEAVLPSPANPNGSVANIAGLSDASGHILGLMPHPERFLDATQHPQWTRRAAAGEAAPDSEGDGMKMFRNAVAHFS